MPALTMGLAEARRNFSRVADEVSRSGRPVTVLRNNRPLVLIAPIEAPAGADARQLDIARDFMDEYADAFEALAR